MQIEVIPHDRPSSRHEPLARELDHIDTLVYYTYPFISKSTLSKIINLFISDTNINMKETSTRNKVTILINESLEEAKEDLSNYLNF